MRILRSPLRSCASIVLVFLWAAAAAFPKTGMEVVVVPVANMYAGPSDKTAVVSQAIYGSNVTVLIARGEWSRIQTTDRYKGRVPSRHIRILLTGSGYATAGSTVQVESLFANLYAEPDVTLHKPVLTIPFETRLEIASSDERDSSPGKTPPEGWLQLRLPDQRHAWVQASDVVSDPKPLSIPESIELAKRFLGLPYLWGGRSSFGFDCSGFTQMLLRARGFNMPRDADQQAAWNGGTPVQRKDLQRGDLLFFGSSGKEVTHTGMYIGDGE